MRDNDYCQEEYSADDKSPIFSGFGATRRGVFDCGGILRQFKKRSTSREVFPVRSQNAASLADGSVCGCSTGAGLGGIHVGGRLVYSS
jgi:hypothetical protein